MNTYTIPPKLAIINDLSGYGRCSLTVALPVVSAMKVQGCPVPTSFFSNHMGYPVYYSHDFSPEIPEYLQKWEELHLSFDGIYCGYLNSQEQIMLIENFILHQKSKNPSCMVLIDPVMGDHGSLYHSVTPDFLEEMKHLISHGDIITPNLTEACLLTDTPYTDSPDEQFLFTLAKKLHVSGAAKIVITGIPGNKRVANYIYESPGSHMLSSQPLTGESRPGTGDLFASILAADAVNHYDFVQSVQKAAQFVSHCTGASHDLNIPINDGVCFENFLTLLY